MERLTAAGQERGRAVARRPRPVPSSSGAIEIDARTVLPTRYGSFDLQAFRIPGDEQAHLALVRGDVRGRGVLARVHSECLTGEVFGSLKCDCGPQLDAALHRIAVAGRGVVVYLRGHEGRGIGLVEKLRAYALQDAGLDTVEANLALGHPVDARDYRAAGAVLASLGVRGVRLLTNNADKVRAVAACGLDCAAVPMPATANPHNQRYLSVKRDRMGQHGIQPREQSEKGA